MRSTIRFSLAAFAIILTLASCGGHGAGLPPLEPAAADEANYRLGPSDKLHVQVLGADDLGGDFFVGDNGTVSSPMIGDVKAAGLTRSELEPQPGESARSPLSEESQSQRHHPCIPSLLHLWAKSPNPANIHMPAACV